ncbi:hypothetical protein HZS_3751 [Henneguya salminicola]|nr:hypothetical protein HZS_3751 [Henneguya salminicola]
MEDEEFQIKPNNFYNNCNNIASVIRKEKNANIEKTEKILKMGETKIEQYKFLNYTWIKFHTLKPAFEYIESKNNTDLRIFSQEIIKNKNSVFCYIVTNIDSFWYEYSASSENSRHLYEVIVENRPCKLYLDLEFYKKYNQNIDGIQLTIHMINYIIKILKSHFNITVEFKDFLWLDSSSDQKYSAHIIMSQKYLFASNVELGYFLKYCADKTQQEHSHLYVATSNRDKTFFADLSKLSLIFIQQGRASIVLLYQIAKGIQLKYSGNCRFFNGVQNNLKNIFISSLVIPVEINFKSVLPTLHHSPNFKSTQPLLPNFVNNTPINLNFDTCEMYLAQKLSDLLNQVCKVELWAYYSDKKYIRYKVTGTKYQNLISFQILFDKAIKSINNCRLEDISDTELDQIFRHFF